AGQAARDRGGELVGAEAVVASQRGADRSRRPHAAAHQGAEGAADRLGHLGRDVAPHDAADVVLPEDVRIELHPRVHVKSASGPAGGRGRVRQEPSTAAITSISTATPRGSPAACTVERAGRCSPKYLPYTSFIAEKSPMSCRKTVVFTTLCSDAPAASRTACRLSSTRSACCATSPPTSSPVAGSRGICPA